MTSTFGRRMKVLIYVIVGVVLLVSACVYLFFGGAVGRLMIPGPSHRLPETVGTAYLRNDPTKRFPVNIESLIPYMRDADWTSDHWTLWKIPVIVELRNGQKLTIDRLGGQYSVDGVPGVFSNRDMARVELDRFGTELNKVLQEWPNHTAEPSSPSRAGSP